MAPGIVSTTGVTLHCLVNVKDSQGHGAGDEQRRFCEIQTRTNTPAETETPRARILLGLLPLRGKVSIGIELKRVRIQAQHCPEQTNQK